MLIMTFLVACSQHPSLPEEQPDDFQFHLTYGFGESPTNEINTFDQTFTKDLVQAGTETISFEWTNEQMATFYNQFRDNHVLQLPSESESARAPCTIPYRQYDLHFVVQGEAYRLKWDSECSTDAIDQWEQFMGNVYENMLNPSEAYQLLPDAVGGYD
ncbi:hypothetical protein MM326_17810 [Alkalihalobacillus sp. LMS6]|uniref:hypothetical protein n=1 Tax=Bacillaceae TaxID=186817 RepID=UPI000C071A57|nr:MULTISPECIES: hypothetical protein [Bacillaceae]UTR05909.1 hypothetical protein MM326_17810 [Alkalihalobacillus sp. LMS6]